VHEIQELAHPWGHDYRSGSPHLLHWHLYQRLLAELRGVLNSHRQDNLPWSVLDVGAGHGSFTEPLLAYGCTITATEMSRSSVKVLRDHYGSNERFSVELDEDGMLKSVGNRSFSLVLFVSVLHHIPDYVAAIEAAASHVLPGGALVTFQDPLWYPTLPWVDTFFSRFAYLWWRSRQGDYLRGVKTRWRWMRGTYDEASPSDMVEYHVARRGVSQDDLREALSSRFRNVRVIPYWSTQSSTWQRVGEALRAENTFGIVATHRCR
jgi:2-polyprenyl-6-hydroxyphenyl methylase / 3-demethylubiquinone-9 3-methyltransferase